MKTYWVTISDPDINNLAAAVQFYAFDQYQGRFTIQNINVIYTGPVYVYTMLVKATAV